jgi:hypothetical protein
VCSKSRWATPAFSAKFGALTRRRTRRQNYRCSLDALSERVDATVEKKTATALRRTVGCTGAHAPLQPRNHQSMSAGSGPFNSTVFNLAPGKKPREGLFLSQIVGDQCAVGIRNSCSVLLNVLYVSKVAFDVECSSEPFPTKMGTTVSNFHQRRSRKISRIFGGIQHHNHPVAGARFNDIRCYAHRNNFLLPSN